MFDLFRKKSARELWTEAETLFAEQRFGDAKLQYDRVEDRAEKERDAEMAQRARSRAAECCDKIAERRVTEARSLAQLGELEMAREELRHARETARSPQVLEQIEEAKRSLEQRDAREQAAAPAELSDEEKLTLISGSWEPLQARELESYGEPLLQALLAIEDERGADALKLIEPLLKTAREPCYLWLELGRARLVAGQEVAATDALRKFLTSIGPEEGGAARIMAHRELARMAHERGDRDGALAELESCASALEEDPRPLLDLGNYLRLIGRPGEAIEVLEMCGSLFPDEAVEWPVTMELGLACAEAGATERAISALEGVLEQLGSRGHHDYPPAPVIALAKIHEQRGNLTRAADLFRALTEGSDVANHALYHREAARLLDALGLTDEARRMRQRAEGLEAPT